jgi:hypothetical protein
MRREHHKRQLLLEERAVPIPESFFDTYTTLTQMRIKKIENLPVSANFQEGVCLKP